VKKRKVYMKLFIFLAGLICAFAIKTFSALFTNGSPAEPNVVSIVAEAAPNAALIPVSIDEKWGYIDKEGNLIIEPRFEQAREFHEDLAIVELGGKLGFIDKRGTFVVEQIFYFINDFADVGLAADLTSDKNDALKYGFINKSGKFVIEPAFDTANVFKEGLADVELNEKWGFINEKGEVVIEPQFDVILRGFDANDLAQVAIDDKLGVIDKKGEWIVEAKYKWLTDFNANGWALGDRGKKDELDDPDGKYDTFGVGFLDKNGEFAVEKDFINLISFDQQIGVATVLLKNGEKAFINKKRERVKLKFDAIYDFKAGLAAFELNGKRGFINEEGNVVIEPAFEYALDFDENGLAFAKINGKWGLIDKAGKFVVEAKFDDDRFVDYVFSNDLAAMKSGDKWGYIDASGEFAIEPQFFAADSFDKNVGLAYVKIDAWKKRGFIDKKGNIVFLIENINGREIAKNAKGEIVWKR
jgi:hypothetical protein